MQYKALSLLQPWASLVVMGAKQIETRSWNTKYRGLLLIHASKAFNGTQTLLRWEFEEKFNLPSARYPLGAIIGCVNLVDTYQSEMFFVPDEIDRSGIEISAQEMAFGDYSPGRYGWLLSDPVMFETPIPCKGSLQLWTPDEATAKLVDQALAAKQSS